MLNMQLRYIFNCAKLRNSTNQIGKFMNKVMKQDQPKKNRHKQSSSINSFIAQPKFINIKHSPENRVNRRVTVLNKIFMKYITDLMSTGEVGEKLLGKGIEVTHVKVMSDYKLVNVYWYSSNEENNITGSIEEILKISAKQLQHELSQLRVIGIVPPINFVKNKKYENTRELDKRLSNIDFEEDFESTNCMIDTNIPVLHTQLSSDIKAKLEEFNNETSNEIESYEISIPEMKHNVLGFDHSYIMNKIKGSLNQVKTTKMGENIEMSRERVNDGQVESETVDEFLSNKEEESRIFDDFLKQRLKEKKRMMRSKPLIEYKLEEETEWAEEMETDFDQDYPLDDGYKDECEDIESQLK